MISGLNHLTIVVKDLDQSYGFYTEVLGLKPIMKSPQNAYLLAGEFWFCLEAAVSERTESNFGPTSDTHFAFTVRKADFETLKNKILDSGAQVWKENRSEGESLYFLDPDSYKIEIHCGDWRSRLQHYSARPERAEFILHPHFRKIPTHASIPSVKLVSFNRSYLDPFIEWRRQKRSLAHNPLIASSREETLLYLQSDSSDLNEFDLNDRFRWFVEFNGEPVGNVSFKNINRMMMFAEIAYGFSEAFHGQGIATEAVRQMIHQIFLKTPIRKLIAYVHDENLPSLRLLDRLGFTQEGVLRKHYLINGKPCNEVVLGLLKEEWPF